MILHAIKRAKERLKQKWNTHDIDELIRKIQADDSMADKKAGNHKRWHLIEHRDLIIRVLYWTKRGGSIITVTECTSLEKDRFKRYMDRKTNFSEFRQYEMLAGCELKETEHNPVVIIEEPIKLHKKLKNKPIKKQNPILNVFKAFFNGGK